MCYMNRVLQTSKMFLLEFKPALFRADMFRQRKLEMGIIGHTHSFRMGQL